jgi:hypothetical protein
MAEITSFQVVSAGYFTFGQVFKKGDVPSGQFLQVKTSTGTAVSSQIDRKTTWSDGSLCHAIITGDWPGTQNLYIHTTTTPESNTPTSVGVLTALPFEVSIEVSVSAGQRYVATFATSASTGNIWLSGSQVTEWQNTSVAFKDVGASVNPHLKAFFYVRGYGDLSNRSVDIVVENGRFLGPNITPTYSVSVNINGTNVYSRSSITHYIRSRWRQKIYQGSGHGLVKLNKAYWDSVRIHPPYDPTLTVSQNSLTSYLNSMTNSSVPMAVGLTNTNMPDTGAADGLGVLPRWTARYLITYDEKARQAMLLGDQAAGGFPTHFRDAATSYPADIDTRSTWGVAGNPSIPDTGWGLGMGVVGCPYIADLAHQPSFGYISYLITGDYYYLEEVQFWASFCLLAGNPDPNGFRGGSQGWLTWDQVRAQAWGIRTLGFAAFITPAGYMKSYFTNKLNNNITRYQTRQAPGGAYYNQLGINNGFLTGSQDYYNFDGFAPWQQHFVHSAVGALRDLEFPVTAWFDFVMKYPMGMMGDDVYWNQAAAYVLRYKYSNTGLFATHREVYLNSDLQTLQTNQMGGSGVESYQANLRSSLAYAYTYRVPGAVSAWERFQSRINQPTQAQWGESPMFAFVPVSVATSLIELPSVPVTGVITCPASINVGTEVSAFVRWTDVSSSTVTPNVSIVWQSNPPGRVQITPNGLNATVRGLSNANNVEITAILSYQISLPSGILPTLTSLGGPVSLSVSVSQALNPIAFPTSLNQNSNVVSRFFINVSASSTPTPTGNLFQVASSMTPGTWAAVPLTNNVVEAKAGMPAWAPDNGAVFANLFQTWNGGCVVITGDTSIDGCYIPACGGHNDYGGNEVYWLKFADMTVYRLTDADTYDDLNCYHLNTCVVQGGARPTSQHTYGGLVYAPNRGNKGSIIVFGGYTYGQVGGPPGDHVLDLEKLHSANPAIKATCWTAITRLPHTGVGTNAVRDPSGNVVYASSPGRIVAFNPTTGTVLSTGGQNFSANAYGGGWDPVNKIFIKFNDPSASGGKVASWQLGNLNIGDNWSSVGNPSGPGTFDTNGNRFSLPNYSRAHAIYHEGLNKFVICNQTKTVWFLDCKTNPSQWTYTSHDPPTGPVQLSFSGGVYGRWERLPAPNSNVFFYWRDAQDKEVWLYKLP